MHMSTHEKRYWQDQAALLDPLAYVFCTKAVQGSGFVETVPVGEQWYFLNAFFVKVSGNAELYNHRTPDVAKATPLTAGTKIEFHADSSYAMHYTCRPERVISKDKRYQDDPKALYFSRLHRLRSLQTFVQSVSIEDGAPYGVTNDTVFPTDFANAIVTSYSNSNMSWGGITGDYGAMNLGPEMSDDHQNRWGERTLFPFVRGLFPKMRARGGSISGAQNVPYIKGNCQVTYVKLPTDW